MVVLICWASKLQLISHRECPASIIISCRQNLTNSPINNLALINNKRNNMSKLAFVFPSRFTESWRLLILSRKINKLAIRSPSSEVRYDSGKWFKRDLREINSKGRPIFWPAVWQFGAFGLMQGQNPLAGTAWVSGRPLSALKQ